MAHIPCFTYLLKRYIIFLIILNSTNVQSYIFILSEYKMRTDNIQIHAFISYIYPFISINMIINLCYDGLEMIQMIIFMFIRIFLIFYDVITFYENLMTLIHQENDLFRDK